MIGSAMTRLQEADSTARELVGWLIGICALLIAVIAALGAHITTVQAMGEATEAVKVELRKEFVPRTELQIRLDNMSATLTEVRRELEKQRAWRENGGR